jgi:chromosome segregation ATPase
MINTTLYKGSFMNLNKDITSLKKKDKLYLALIIVVVVAIIVGGALSGNHSNGTSNVDAQNQKLATLLATANSAEQAFNKCLVPANKTMVELNKLKTQMDAYNSAGDTANYNALVPHQNELVELHNTQVKDCDAVGDTYYAAKASYNNYLDDIQHGK